MSIRRSAPALSQCVLWLCWSVVAKAQSVAERPALNWVRLPGAESCIGAAELSDRIAARIGSRLFESVHDAQLFVDGFVEPEADGFKATLSVSDRSGRSMGRRLLPGRGSDCRSLDEALVLVAAITLHPKSARGLDDGTLAELDTLFARDPPELDPGTLPQPTAATPAPAEKRDHSLAENGASTRNPATRTSWLDLNVQAGLGSLPRPHVGLSARWRLQVTRLWPVELGLRVLWPQATALSAQPEGEATARVSFMIMSASLAVCPTPLALHDLTLCIGLDMGRDSALARGFAVSRSVHSLLLDATAALVWRPKLTARTHLRLGMALVTALRQRTYTYENLLGESVELQRAPRLGAWAEAGWGANF